VVALICTHMAINSPGLQQKQCVMNLEKKKYAYRSFGLSS